MPIYQYRCRKCDKIFDILDKMPGKPEFKCPDCGKLSERIMSACNYTFGWRLSDDSHIRGHKDKLVKDI